MNDESYEIVSYALDNMNDLLTMIVILLSFIAGWCFFDVMRWLVLRYMIKK